MALFRPTQDGNDDSETSAFEQPTTVAAAQLLKVPIEAVPLGARVPTKNPRPWEYDDSLPEPDQSSWAKLSITMYRTDGGIVDVELIRPRSWIQSVGVEAGKLFPVNIEELEVKGSALVTAIDDCPPIVEGEGSVVTARYCTREVNTIARVSVVRRSASSLAHLEAEGRDLSNLTPAELHNLAQLGLVDLETLSGTPIHPIWSEDRQDWVPLGELAEGETLRSASGIATVLSIAVETCSLPVYNIEVHGQHVYQIGDFAVLVHNASQWRCAMIAKYGEKALEGLDVAHIIPREGWRWAPDKLHQIIKRVTDAGLINDVENLFLATAGHAGTHTKEYVKDLIAIMKDRYSIEDMLEGIGKLWKRIEAGKYL